MKELRNPKATCTSILILTLIVSLIVGSLPAINGLQIGDIETRAFISVSPNIIGLGQMVAVILWIHPAPLPPDFHVSGGYTDITVTFTRPNGSYDNFLSPGYGLPPGETDCQGSCWFTYIPDQTGEWSVQFTFPGQTIYDAQANTVYYKPVSSPSVTFTVQIANVTIPYAPLPDGYWEHPINVDNRYWAQISGSWLQSAYDGGPLQGSSFNPYSTAPNTPHVVWKRKVHAGGVIGDPWGNLNYPELDVGPLIATMGNLYYNDVAGGTFSCIDLRSGELIYRMNGSVTHGWYYPSVDPHAPNPERLSPVPYLWGLSSTEWKMYDPFTGGLLRTITNVPGVGSGYTCRWFDGDPYVYCIRQSGWNTTIPNRLTVNELIKWDFNRVNGTDWTSGVVWKTPLKQPDGSGPGEGNQSSGFVISPDLNVGVVYAPGENQLYLYDLVTGAYLVTRVLDFRTTDSGFQCSPADEFNFFYLWDNVNMEFHVHDVETLNSIWEIPVGEYPWGSRSNMPYLAIAYGFIYTSAFDGYVYCLNPSKGQVEWNALIGMDLLKTPFSHIVPWGAPTVADGKVYIQTRDVGLYQSGLSGARQFCLDAFTGEVIWSLPGIAMPDNKIVVDGYLVGINTNDGVMYAFNKGKTATTVSIQNNVITNGSSTLIEGTVMDMSPSQPCTPCVSEESMREWMSYLHMQNATLINNPPSPAGVPVKLFAVGPDGNLSTIGAATSDSLGRFKHMWMPNEVGIYTILASFEGDESYWSSSAHTALLVTTALSSSEPIEPEDPTQPEQPEEPEQPAEGFLVTPEIAIIALIAAAFVVVIPVSYRLLKRGK